MSVGQEAHRMDPFPRLNCYGELESYEFTWNPRIWSCEDKFAFELWSCPVCILARKLCFRLLSYMIDDIDSNEPCIIYPWIRADS